MRRMLMLLATLLSLTAAAAAPATLRIATGEFPPYATETRPDQGIALSIVRRAFEHAGYRVEFVFLPWSRALAETRVGKWDGTAYWGYKPENLKTFYLSNNVLTEQWVMLYRKNLDFDWQTLADLQPYLLGVINYNTYTTEFWGMVKTGELKADSTPDELAALRKLVNGRIDVTPLERNVACDLLTRHFTEGEAGRVRAHPRLLTDTFTTHLMLPRQRSESRELMARFNEGLKQVYASGEHARLLKQVRCPASWAEASTSPTPR